LRLDVAELEVDDMNEKEMANHGISAHEIFQLLDDRIEVFRNKKGRSAQLIMMGMTHGGRVIVAPIVRTAVEGQWRPVTAWEASAPERARYQTK
jgi:uncharacterized DUF497 family protein